MNKLLARQIKKHLGVLSADEQTRFAQFFAAVEASYDDNESDRLLMEHSLEISSKEMLAKNRSLQEEAYTSAQALENLRGAIHALTPNSFSDNGEVADIGQEVVRLTNFLKELIVKDKQLDAKKNEFVSIASHELRTPMTIIRSYAAILKAGTYGTLSDKQLHYVDRIIVNTTHLITLVGDMLNISKLEAGKLEFHSVSFAPEDVIREHIESFRDLYDNKSVRLEFLPSGDTQVYADPERFKQILTNLLSNALKFTEAHGVVRVSAHVQENEPAYVRFSVTDSGIGIPQEAQKALFEKFSQIDNVLQRQSEGTGLGLVICKELVERMGGSIGVQSQEGEGSTFWFTLPLVNMDMVNS